MGGRSCRRIAVSEPVSPWGEATVRDIIVANPERTDVCQHYQEPALPPVTPATQAPFSRYLTHVPFWTGSFFTGNIDSQALSSNVLLKPRAHPPDSEYQLIVSPAATRHAPCFGGGPVSSLCRCTVKVNVLHLVLNTRRPTTQKVSTNFTGRLRFTRYGKPRGDPPPTRWQANVRFAPQTTLHYCRQTR